MTDDILPGVASGRSSNAPATTPPHQDFPNNQGSEDLTAAWVPLGDCPNHMGPLKVLKGSHKYGILPMRHHLGPGSRAARIPDALNHLTWHRSPFEAGDVLLFSALTVHAATDNLDASKMRLSVDYRYQTEGSPLTAGCLEPHFERLSWEEVYKDWKSDSLKYYWRSKKYQVVEWDDRMHDLSPEEAAEGMRMALEYAAHRGFAHAGRSFRGAGARVACQMQSIDELRHAQTQLHAFSHYNKFFNYI